MKDPARDIELTAKAIYLDSQKVVPMDLCQAIARLIGNWFFRGPLY